MEKLNLTQAKDLILNNNLGSIYSKEDVINLLNRIEEEKQVQKFPLDLEEIKDKVIDDINSTLRMHDGDDIIDKDSAEFSICYGNKIEIERIDYSFDILESALNDGIEELFNKLINNQSETE